MVCSNCHSKPFTISPDVFHTVFSLLQWPKVNTSEVEGASDRRICQPSVLGFSLCETDKHEVCNLQTNKLTN